MTRTLIGLCFGSFHGSDAIGPAVTWWWIALTCIEVGWVLGVWLVVRDTDPPPAKPEAAPGGTREWCRGAFVWGYFLYHLPLLLVDYLTSGWVVGRMLEGRGAWLLVQAALIGAATVAAYGTVLTWVFA